MDGKTLLEPNNYMNDLIEYWNKNKHNHDCALLIYSYLITQANIYICCHPTQVSLEEIDGISDNGIAHVILYKLWLKLLFKYIDEAVLYKELLALLTKL